MVSVLCIPFSLIVTCGIVWAQGKSLNTLTLLGLIVGIGGQLGDLVISYIKRDIGIKDMGTILPGCSREQAVEAAVVGFEHMRALPTYERAGALRRISAGIAAQAERAGEIIRQLRSFVRKDQPERRLVDLRTVIREAAVLFEPEARRAGVQLRMRLGEAPVQVMAWTLSRRIISASESPSSAVLIAPARVTIMRPPPSRWSS